MRMLSTGEICCIAGLRWRKAAEDAPLEGNRSASRRRGVVRAAQCGGGLLAGLGLPEGAVRNVVMSRDIVPRAFACDYALVADILKRVSPSFRDHRCLAGGPRVVPPAPAHVRANGLYALRLHTVPRSSQDRNLLHAPTLRAVRCARMSLTWQAARVIPRGNLGTGAVGKGVGRASRS